MNDNLYAIVLLPSANYAMRAEKILLSLNIKCKLIPVPREISANCGVGVRISRGDKEKARSILEEINLKIDRIRDF